MKTLLIQYFQKENEIDVYQGREKIYSNEGQKEKAISLEHARELFGAIHSKVNEQVFPNRDAREPKAKEMSDVAELVRHAIDVFPTAFVNDYDELIFNKKHNVYFRLEGVDTPLSFQCKMFAWLSRPISKGLPKKEGTKMLQSFNELLNTSFTLEDMRTIYTYLGNDVNRPLCEQFIASGYDMSLLA